MTPDDFEALRRIVLELHPTILALLVRHLYRLKNGMTMGTASTILLTELGMPATEATELVDAAMSDRLDRSARTKVMAGK